jgi:drug/metabolite transporter (DMT)-like permease
LLGEQRAIPQLPTTWYSLGFTVIFGSVVLFGLYFWLLRTYAATTASYVFLVSPVATLALGAWLANEQITMAVVVGGLLIIGGVYVGAIRGLTSRPRSA